MATKFPLQHARERERERVRSLAQVCLCSALSGRCCCLAVSNDQPQDKLSNWLSEFEKIFATRVQLTWRWNWSRSQRWLPGALFYHSPPPSRFAGREEFRRLRAALFGCINYATLFHEFSSNNLEGNPWNSFQLCSSLSAKFSPLSFSFTCTLSLSLFYGLCISFCVFSQVD